MAAAGRPNILVVLTDDHGQWALGCYGTPQIHSPNMDDLAATGARMAGAFTPTPVCSPARACFYTGRFASQHGIHDWLQEQTERIGDRDWMAGERTLYEQLAGAGYHVGHFGKWHCGRSHVPQPGAHRWFSLPRGQGSHRGAYAYSDEGVPVVRRGFKSRIITDEAIRFIRGDHGDRPWFAFVGMIATHGPHAGLPDRLVGRYRTAANALVGTIDPPPDAFRVYHKDRVPELQAQYFAAVTELDEQLGRLLDAIDDRDELDGTVVVYTADHGLHAGQLGYWEKGNGTRPINMYERSIRIPMLLRAPGQTRPGQVREEFVDLCDLYHTLLEWGHASLSDEQRRAGCHVGHSFAPMLAGQHQSWRQTQIGEYGPVRMIRTARYKLVRRHGHGEDQLFDLAQDPDERDNALSASGGKDIAAKLDEKLAAFFAEHEDPARSGLRGREEEGKHNAHEPWRREYDDYVCKGWSS